MIENPLVSVLMTAFNREQYIAEAIESIIASTFQNWELIIVDDGSTDQTVEIAKAYESKENRIKVYINEKNQGQFQNRNKAASYALGKYIKFLDSDDLVYPHSLEIMITAMEQFPEAGLGIPYTQWLTYHPYPIVLLSKDALIDHFFKSNFLAFGPSATIYNRDFFNEIGGFDEKYKVAADYAFNLKAACCRPVAVFQKDLNWWRIHDGQEYKTKELEYIEVNFSCIKDHLLKDSCPLNLSERKIIISNTKRINARKVIIYFIKLKFHTAKEIIKHYELRLMDFVLILKRNKRIKSIKI